ncbi:MAG: hypothetical protein KC635_20865 [Myxococcales bacterium]|nr:hypothetical protein [Myxococcales bacterium]
MSRALLAAAALVALTACDAAVPVDGARGEPLLSLDADLVTQAVPPGARVALGLFWLPPGADALDRAQWREDAARPAAAVALDAPLVVRLFAPPPADVALGRPFVLGALVAYDDADGDGRLGPGEAVLGGAPRDFVLWAPAPVAAVGSPLRRDVGPGFHAVAVTDLGCPTRLVEAAPSCGDELGRACATDADCGSDGLCATVVDGRPVPGGVCAKRSTCASPRVRRGGRVASLDAFVLGCERDDACRTAEGHACVPVDYGTWGCLPPAERLCDAPVGAACARDADCGDGGSCVLEVRLATGAVLPVPGGHCRAALGASGCTLADGVWDAAYDGQLGLLARCGADGDCRAGWACDGWLDACLPPRRVAVAIGAFPAFEVPVCR